MTTHSVIFDGAVRASAGVSVSHTRAWPTVDAAGQAVPANQLAFGPAALVTAPPANVVVVDDTVTTLEHACMGSGGRWSDGTPCVVRARVNNGNNNYDISIFRNMAIATNCFKDNANAYNTTQIRWLSGADATFNPGNWKNTLYDLLKGSNTTTGYANGLGSFESGSWRYDPLNILIENGCVLAYCQAYFNNGGADQSRAVSLCAFDPAASGANKWQLVVRTPSVDIGNGHGNVWACQEAFQFPSDPLTRWVPFVDYRAATATPTPGGELWLLKLTRATINSAFVPGTAAPLMHLENSIITHFHGVSMVPYGASGMQIIVHAGDGRSARTFAITRDDLNYLEGYNFGSGSVTEPGSNLTWPVPALVPGSNAPITANGFTLRPDIEGDPDTATQAIAFTNATWTNAAKTLTGANSPSSATVGAFANFWLVLTSGSGVTAPVAARIVTHSGTTITVDRAGIATDGLVSGYISRGFIAAQPVARCHRFGSNTIFLGSDESGIWGYRGEAPTYTGGNDFMAYSHVPGRSLPAKAGLFSGASGAVNTFLAAGGGAESQGPFAFASDTGASWAADMAVFARLMYMPAGVDYAASMYANQVDNTNRDRICWYTDPATGRRYLLFGPDANSQILAIPEPDSAVVRPAILGQPAIVNKMLGTTVDKSATVLASLCSGSTYTLKTNADLATLVPGHPIPPPPCTGELAHVKARNVVGFIREVTGSGAEGIAAATPGRLEAWIYPLPPPNDGTAPPYAQGLINPAFALSKGAYTDFRVATYGGVALSVGGWIPITLELPAPSAFTENNTGAPSLWSGNSVLQVSEWYSKGQAAVNIGSDFLWGPRDYLIAWNTVTQAATGELPALSPPQSTGTASTSAASKTTVTLPAPIGTSWVVFFQGKVPTNGPDYYSTGRPASYLFTLKDGSGHYHKVLFDPGIGLTVRDESANDLADFSGDPPKQRGDWITIAIAKDAVAPVTTLYYAIGGNVVQSFQDGGLHLNALNITTIISGDQNGASVDPVEGGRFVVISSALSDGEILARLALINFGEAQSTGAGLRGRGRGRDRWNES